MAQRPSYMPIDREQAERMLAGKDTRKIGNNTYVERVFGEGTDTLVVRYHRTNIVTFLKDGTVTLHSGGYRTTTTKARLHEVSSVYGWSLSQRQHVWYLTHRPSGTVVEFFDGFDVTAPVAAEQGVPA